MLGLPGPFAVIQRGHDRIGSSDPAKLVGDNRGSIGRWVVGVTHRGQSGHAGDRLDAVVIGGLVAIRPVRAEPDCGHGNQLGIAFAQGLGGKGQPRQRSGADAGYKYIRIIQQVKQSGAVLLGFQIKGNAALVAICAQKCRTHTRRPGRLHLTQHVAFGAFDLDDIGTQITKHLRGKGAEYNRRHVDDPDACKHAVFTDAHG